MLVTTAIGGLIVRSISWKDDNSKITQSKVSASSIRSSMGVPIFPRNKTFLPPASRARFNIWAVVPFPFVPVMPMMFASDSSKKIWVFEVTFTPAFSASTISGI